MSERVPEGWSFKKLSDVGKCIRGLTYSPDNVVDNGLLVLRSSNIQNDQISLSDNIYVNIHVETEFLTQPSDILICVRNGSRHLLGKSAFIDDKLPRATHGAFMTIYRSELNDFFRHHIKSDQFFIQVSRDIGATINSINTGNLLEYKFLTPPLPEQKKIASILTSVDEVIETTQKQIDKLQDLKKATMNELLTKGIGHTEFKDSELGRIPKSWEIVSLLSVSKKIKRGPSLSCNTEGKGIRYITSGNLVSDEVSLDGDYKFLDNFTDIEKCRLLKNDLVLSCVNSAARIGESAIFSLNIDAIIGFNNYAITLHADICDPNFIHYFTKTHLFKRQLKSVIKDAINQVSFSTKDLDLIQIALPSKSEQSEISQNINSIWKNEKILLRKLSQTQSLKKSLMQDLLTGKVRV